MCNTSLEMEERSEFLQVKPDRSRGDMYSHSEQQDIQQLLWESSLGLTNFFKMHHPKVNEVCNDWRTESK